MKKLIAILLAVVLVLAAAPAALAEEPEVRVSEQKFQVDGKDADLSAYNIDGYNYVQLRSLAAALNGTEKQFSVDFLQDGKTIVAIPGEAYTPDEAAYNAPAVMVDENGLVTNAAASAQRLMIGDLVCTDLSVYNIGGFNYFKLAELKPYLGFGLSYSEVTRTVSISGGGEICFLPPAAESYAQIYQSMAADAIRAAAENGAEEEAEAAETPAPSESRAAPAANTGASTATADTVAAAGGDAGGYSGTNVQVEGIDEGDIVKTDGTYIYVLNGRYHLTVIEAGGAGSRVISQTAVGVSEYNESGEKEDYSYSSKNKRPQEMFVSDGKLVILSNYYSYSSYTDSAGEWHWENEQYSCVDILDVSDPAHPKPLSALGQDGSIIGSRMQDGHIYLVTRYWVRNYEEDDPDTYIPVIYTNGTGRVMPAGSIYICTENSRQYVVVGDYDLESNTLADVKSLLGSGNEIYMSADNLYVLGSVRETAEFGNYTESVYKVTEYLNTASTTIFRFDLAGGGLELAAGGKIAGYIDSQFSADEYDGYLRIVTTRDESTYTVYEDESYGFRNYKWGDGSSSSGLYVLDAALNEVCSVTGLAKDEYVYSVRFDGDIAYFCTYRNVDPLFAVDVGDPANPRVLSTLKITGFSEYLHSWTDGKLFGFGYEADEETGRTEGLKLVMFDTTDRTDVKVENTLKLDIDYSEALYNHKAFFIVPQKNIIGFVGDGDYYVYSYDESAGFRQLCHFEFDGWEYNVRGLYIGDWAYVVGNSELKAVSMENWKDIATLDISAGEEDGDVVILY